MSRFLCWLIFLFLSCSPAFAGERFTIDPEHTFSSFEYKYWGVSLKRGRFENSSGFIEFDLAARSGTIDLEIDSSSVATGSDIFNRILRSDSFFDAKRFPKIVFNSTRLVFKDEKLFRIEGELRIKKTTRPVVLEVTQFTCSSVSLLPRQTCAASGKTKILRSDYAVGRFVPFVSDEITLYFSVEAVQDTALENQEKKTQ